MAHKTLKNNVISLSAFNEFKGPAKNIYPGVQLPVPIHKSEAEASRRRQKHDMLLTFMANVNIPQQKRRPAPVKTTILKTLLSFLF
jgi:hypothetical protein